MSPAPTSTAPPPAGGPGPILTPGTFQSRSFVKVLAGILAVVAILGGGLLWLESRKASDIERKATVRQHVILRPRDEAGDWRAKEGSRVEELSRTIENLNREIRQMKDQQTREQDKDERGQGGRGTGRTRSDGSAVPPPPPLDRILPQPGEQGQAGAQTPPPGAPARGRDRQAAGPTPATPPVPGTPSLPGAPTAPVPLPPKSRVAAPGTPALPGSPAPALPGIPGGPGEGDGTADGGDQTPGVPSGPGGPFGRSPSASGGGPRNPLASDTGKIRVITPRSNQAQKPAAPQEKVGWLPSGSMIPARLLTGIDASTLAGQSMPYPVLIRLTDSAMLPNDFRMNIINCVAVGAAIADLASERVEIRTESLSCLLKRGGGLVTIDGDFKSSVIGGDGKMGIRGRMVMKEGALIARTMVAGFLGGLSQAFGPRISYAPVQLGDVNNPQTFSPPPPAQAMLAAGMAGFGKSMDRLANFYQGLAEKTAPVIEVSAGIPVDLMVVKGIALKWRASSATEQQSDVIE